MTETVHQGTNAHGTASTGGGGGGTGGGGIGTTTVKVVGPDNINRPQHYTWLPGIECIEVAEYFTFNLGTVIQYIWRATHKGGIEDLKKARWHLDREIKKLENGNRPDSA